MKIIWPALPLLLLLVSCGSGVTNSTGTTGTTGNPGGGGGGGGSSQTGIAGKWTISSTSAEGHLNSILLANLSDGGNGTFTGSDVVLCYSNPTLTCYGGFNGNGSLSIQGTLSAQGAVTMIGTSFPQGATGCTSTYTGSLSGSTMTATYTGCQDAGTMTATASPSVTGTYTGQLASGAHPGLFPFGISASITEASDHTLSGVAALTNSPCFTSLTFGPPSVAVGDAVYLVDAIHEVVVITPLGSPTNLSAPFFSYSISPTLFCTADYGSGTLTKH